MREDFTWSYENSLLLDIDPKYTLSTVNISNQMDQKLEFLNGLDTTVGLGDHQCTVMSRVIHISRNFVIFSVDFQS